LAIKEHETGKDELEDSEASQSDEAQKQFTYSKSEKQLRELETLQNELDLERTKSSDLVNRMRYLQADIANLQRQADHKVSEVRNQVKLTWILEILSIKEDLDRAVGIAKESREKSSLLDGLMLVSSRIENILKLESVEVVRASVGGQFDPALHEALAFQESETEEQGTILAVISPGYIVDGRVIKPTMVEVVRRKEKRKFRDEKPAEPKKFANELEVQEATAENKS
jgi:molecular chaperone GrpE